MHDEGLSCIVPLDKNNYKVQIVLSEILFQITDKAINKSK